MTTLEKIARAIDPHPFLELDKALLTHSGDTMDALYINRLRLHTETPLANARKAVEAMRDPPPALYERLIEYGFASASDEEVLGFWNKMLDAILSEKP